MYKQNLALNNLLWLIRHKPNPTNQPTYSNKERKNTLNQE